MIKDQKALRQKAAEAEKAQKDLAEIKGQLALRNDEIAGLRKGIVDKEEEHRKTREDVEIKGARQARVIKCLVGVIGVLVITLILLLILVLNRI